MIVDSSALLAILLSEPEAEAFANTVLAADAPRISAANYLETAIVADARSPAGQTAEGFDEVVRSLGLAVVDVSRRQAELAREAYRRFGKGRHGARLNFGDCFAYALAREAGEPLLFKGDDFARTDVARAL